MLQLRQELPPLPPPQHYCKRQPLAEGGVALQVVHRAQLLLLSLWHQRHAHHLLSHLRLHLLPQQWPQNACRSKFLPTPLTLWFYPPVLQRVLLHHFSRLKRPRARLQRLRRMPRCKQQRKRVSESCS